MGWIPLEIFMLEIFIKRSITTEMQSISYL